jgi:hypothetical protein
MGATASMYSIHTRTWDASIMGATASMYFSKPYMKLMSSSSMSTYWYLWANASATYSIEGRDHQWRLVDRHTHASEDIKRDVTGWMAD